MRVAEIGWRWRAGRLHSRRLLSSWAMKIISGLTHAVRKESLPTRDWSCFFVKNEAAWQVVNVACKSIRFIVGTSRVKATVGQIIEVEGRRWWIYSRMCAYSADATFVALWKFGQNGKRWSVLTDLFNYKYGSFSLQLFVINLKPSTHHLPRLALLFAGGVIFVYLM